LLQFALVATFVWPNLLWRAGPAWLTPAVAWFLVLGFWIGGIRSALGLRREIARQAKGDPQAVEPLLREAQIEYLKGHWVEAESRLRKLLEDRPSDAEAQLLLVTLYRRTGRVDDARRQLDGLLQLSSAGRWVDEIEAEARRLNAAQTPEVAAVVLKVLNRAA
jgi:predicted Zn-dependent protease